MMAQLLLLGFTLAALALPVSGLLSGTLPDFGFLGFPVSRSDRPKTFWFLFTVYGLMAGALFLCSSGEPLASSAEAT